MFPFLFFGSRRLSSLDTEHPLKVDIGGVEQGLFHPVQWALRGAISMLASLEQSGFERDTDLARLGSLKKT